METTTIQATIQISNNFGPQFRSPFEYQSAIWIQDYSNHLNTQHLKTQIHLNTEW